MYFLVLLQCWKDETCAFEYGGALRPDSKVLLFIYFRLKNLLKKAGVIDFHLYQVKNKTNWSIAMQTKYTPDELTSQRKRHQEAKEEMTAFKEWMYQCYEAEAICKYNDLRASGSDFDALPHCRIDTIRGPGDKEQFRRERATDQQRMKSAPGAPGVSLDAERQRLHQAESEEQQDYSRQHDEEIRFREGGTPSPITYDSSSPSKATLRASTKKISWAEYQSRLPRDHWEQTQEKEAEWHKEMKQQQEELESQRCEVDRLKREQEKLVLEWERLRAGQEQLDRLRAEQEQQERWRLEQERQEPPRTEQEHLAVQAQAAAGRQTPFGSHMPVHDEHGQNLDYIDNLELEQQNAETGGA